MLLSSTEQIVSPRLTLEDEYRKVITSAGIIKREHGILELRGRDRLDFLHRLSTNDLARLNPGECVATVFVTEKARIIDFVFVLHCSDMTLLVTDDSFGARLGTWLEKFIFTEDVQVSDVTHDYTSYILLGTQATSVLSVLIDSEDIRDPNRFIDVNNAGTRILSYSDVRWQIPCRAIIVKSNTKGVGADFPSESRLLNMSTDVFDVLRIENGIPTIGKELTEQVNPLEANLELFVSFTKGCYIGQEVIARLDTYKKLQRKLTGFVFDETRESMADTGRIFYDNEEVGWTSSHCWSYKLNKAIALGYLKLTPNSTLLEFESKEIDTRIPLSVHSLPFGEEEWKLLLPR